MTDTATDNPVMTDIAMMSFRRSPLVEHLVPVDGGQKANLEFEAGIAADEIEEEARRIETGGAESGGGHLGIHVDDKLREVKPIWEADRDLLSFDGAPVRTVRPIAQWRPILDAFQEENWPIKIDNPLDSSVNLSEALRTLNTGLDQLCFERDGTGEGIKWRLADDAE